MHGLKRIVAGALVAIVAAATAVRPACAVTCRGANDGAVVAGPSATTITPDSHCAHLGHASPVASSRVAATDVHPCGAHRARGADDARLPRIDPGIALALVEATRVIALPARISRLVDRHPSGLPPPGPPRSPLVLRV